MFFLGLNEITNRGDGVGEIIRAHLVVTVCHMKLSKGMQIVAQSKEVKDLRRTMIE